MNLIFGFLFFGLSPHFADEKAAYIAAHELCPDTFVERIDDRSYFECEDTAYVVSCHDGSCDVREREDVAGRPQIGRAGGAQPGAAGN